jgi:hypothetical protein
LKNISKPKQEYEVEIPELEELKETDNLPLDREDLIKAEKI